MNFLSRVFVGVLFVTVLGGILILSLVQTLLNVGFKIGG